MAGAFSSSRSGVLLFDEDFDLPPSSTPSEPEVIEPLFTLAELRAAREEAAAEARESALAEVSTSAMTTSSQALVTISEQIAAARDEVAGMCEQATESVVRLLLGCFATAFPALSARHGADEAAAVLRAVLPVLRREPTVIVRVNPRIIEAIAQEIEHLDGELSAHVRLVATDQVAVGDARVTWEHGSATRDAASLWRQIENILAPAGLLNPDGMAPDRDVPIVKEQELVQ